MNKTTVTNLIFLFITVLLMASLLRYLHTPTRLAEKLQRDSELSPLYITETKDSLAIRSLDKILTANPLNAEVKMLIKQLIKPDSLNTSSRAPIAAYNTLTCKQLMDPVQRKAYLRSPEFKTNRTAPDTLIFRFRGLDLKAEIKAYPENAFEAMTDNSGLMMSLISAFFIFIALFSSGFKYRKLFVAGLAITWAVILNSVFQIIMINPPILNEVSKLLTQIQALLIFIPLLLLIKPYLKIYTWLLLLFFPLSYFVVEDLYTIGYAFVLIFLIIKEKGIYRRFYREYIYMFLMVFLAAVTYSWLISRVFTTGNSLYSIGYRLGKMFTEASPLLNQIYVTIMQSAVYIAIFSFILIYWILYFRVIRVQIKLMENFFLIIYVLLLVFIFSTALLSSMLLLQDRFDWVMIGFGVCAIIGLLVARFIIRRITLFHPVRFDLRKKSLELMNRSYSFTDRKLYTEFFLAFLKGMDKHYKISWISADQKIGDNLEQFSDSRLNEIVALIPEGKTYLNADLEILNETSIGKQILDLNAKTQLRLFYPVVSDSQETEAVLVFGRAPGIYWHESLCKAFSALVNIFRGFYLNMQVQENLRIQSENLVREQESRQYHEKLAQLTQEKNAQLESEKKRIMDSIEYASLIQKSILPQASELEKALKDYFVIWQPRDIVGGDFYWYYAIPDSQSCLFAVVDCTGHGVPGALMSIAANSALMNIVKDQKLHQPARILEQLHLQIGEILHQQSDKSMQDGMDMSLIRYNKASGAVCFAGAGHNLTICHDEGMEVIAGGKYSLGGLKWKQSLNFEQSELTLKPGETIYLFSDGILDQPQMDETGKLKRLGTAAWQSYLQSLQSFDLARQKELITAFILSLMEKEEQRDDICIVGLRH